VFGAKASVTSSDDSTSTKSEGDDSTGKEPEQASTISSDGPASGAIGPVPPADFDFDPEEQKKAEEYKTQGNDFYKGK
jgi:hypothetical protein